MMKTSGKTSKDIWSNPYLTEHKSYIISWIMIPNNLAKINGQSSGCQFSGGLSKHNFLRGAFTSHEIYAILLDHWLIFCLVSYSWKSDAYKSKSIASLIPNPALPQVQSYPSFRRSRAFPRYRINHMHDYPKTEGIRERSWWRRAERESDQDGNQFPLRKTKNKIECGLSRGGFILL